MALFKILKGASGDLGTSTNSKHAIEGYCYFTPDNGKFYIDIAGKAGDNVTPVIGTNRIPLNAEVADKLRNAPVITYVTKDGDTNKNVHIRLNIGGHVIESDDPIPVANSTHTGLVSLGGQTFYGTKTFNSSPVFSNGATLGANQAIKNSDGISIISLASSTSTPNTGLYLYTSANNNLYHNGNIVLTEANYANTLDDAYVNISGDTMTGTLITRGNVLAEGTNTDARMVKAGNSVHGVALYTSSTQRGLYDTKSSKFIFYQGTSNNTVHAVLPLVLDTGATFQVTDGASTFGGTVALNENTTLASAKYLYFGGTTYYINGSGTAKLNSLTAGNITPAANTTYNLGSSTVKWSNVYATTFQGNATSASKWATARNFTIGAATRSVNGSADVSWTVPETGAISHWSLGKGYTFLWGSQDSDTNWKTIATYQDVSTNATTSKWNGATVKGIIHYVTSNMHDGQVVDIPFTATFTSYAGNGTTAKPLAPADKARLYIPASCTVDIIRIVRIAVNHFELQMRVPALYKWVRTQFSIAGTVSLVKVPAEIVTTTNTSAAVVADYQNNFIRLTDAKYAYYDGTDATGTWAISITGSAGSAATAIKLTNAKTFITDLASTTAGSFDGSANVSLGVTGVLPLSHGGTGNTEMTTNRLVWSEDAIKLTAGYHYASSTKVAINSTSAPAETFYVNGSTKINGALTATSLNLTTIEKTMSLSTQDYWYDTGIIGSHLATGTYIIQISRVDSNKTEYWSGIMSWCSTANSNPNDAERYNEIVLHNAGEYPGSVSHIMARTVRTTSGTKLQLCVSGTTMSSLKITFKCAKII